MRGAEHGAHGHPRRTRMSARSLLRVASCSARDHHEAQEKSTPRRLRCARQETARGGYLYATLEPCKPQWSHAPVYRFDHQRQGRARRRRCRDPIRTLTGGGIEALKPAGVEVGRRMLEARRSGLIEPWTKFVTTGVPYVVLKLALSVDVSNCFENGSIEMGHRPEAVRVCTCSRAQHDAV